MNRRNFIKTSVAAGTVMGAMVKLKMTSEAKASQAKPLVSSINARRRKLDAPKHQPDDFITKYIIDDLRHGRGSSAHTDIAMARVCGWSDSYMCERLVNDIMIAPGTDGQQRNMLTELINAVLGGVENPPSGAPGHDPTKPYRTTTGWNSRQWSPEVRKQLGG